MESLVPKPLHYYSKQFWDDNGDPLMSSLFGMQYPWFFLSLGLNAALFCKFWGPTYMKNRKPFDLRPVYIIVNGLAFGTYMLGVLLGFFCSNYFLDCFDCKSYDPKATDLPHICLKYLGYLMVWTKVYDFSIPILSVFSKKNYKITSLQLAHLFFALLFVWSGAKTNPGGVVILIAFNDTFYQLLVYSYMIMTAASPEIKPIDKSFRLFLFTFRVVTVLLTLVHQLYFIREPNCYLKELQIFSICYCVLTSILYPLDAYQRIKERQKESDKSGVQQLEKFNVAKHNKISGNINNNKMKITAFSSPIENQNKSRVSLEGNLILTQPLTSSSSPSTSTRFSASTKMSFDRNQNRLLKAST
jgi:hypothetical protein